MAVFRKQLKTCTLRANCSDALSLQAEWLLGTVAEYEGQGKGLAHGVIVHVGWALLQLRADGNELAICEPDFAGNALREFRDEVTTMLTMLLFQRELMLKVGLASELIRHDEKVVLKRGVLAEPSIYMQRQQTKQGDSGWYIGPVKNNSGPPTSDDLEAKWVYQLLAERARLLDVMLLPVGSLVIWHGDQIIGIEDPDRREIWNTEPSV